MTGASLNRIVRYGLVGVTSAISYAALFYLLSKIISNAGAANFLAILGSLVVSYAGHHRFTFEFEHGHSQSLPRFLISSALLMTLFALLAYVYVDLHGGSRPVVAAFTVFGYPVLSFIVHSAWSFRPR